jgi:2-phosphosulfolactate phosphatase
MHFHRATLDDCYQATGLVVVIDVLRAFSTAAYAFAAGARRILAVSTIEEAFALQLRFPDSLLLGEFAGQRINGFHFDNSPSQICNKDLSTFSLIQRTSAGTQGIVRSTNADILIACSFVNARATVRHIRQFNPTQVTFVITGAPLDQELDGNPIARGDEDAACADYLQLLLENQDPDPDIFLQRVRQSPWARALRQLQLDHEHDDHLRIDMEYCLRVNHFNFAMPVRRSQDLNILEKAL